MHLPGSRNPNGPATTPPTEARSHFEVKFAVISFVQAFNEHNLAIEHCNSIEMQTIFNPFLKRKDLSTVMAHFEPPKIKFNSMQYSLNGVYIFKNLTYIFETA